MLNRFLIKELKEANAQFSKLEQVVDVNFKRAVASGLPELGRRSMIESLLREIAELVARLPAVFDGAGSSLGALLGGCCARPQAALA